MSSILERVQPIRTLGARLRRRMRSSVIETMPNLVLNRILNLRPLTFDGLHQLPTIELRTLDISANEHLQFLSEFYPCWHSQFENALYKKLLEFYMSYRLLDIRSTDTYLDAAGGNYTYIAAIRSARRILHDRFINTSLQYEMKIHGVEILESAAECISLPDSSVDKISCHHSIEHFHGDSDTRFVQEIQRLLKPQGMACIVPIFVSDKYYEITDSLRSWIRDPRSSRAYDPTSPFPGGEFSGRLARVYDPKALVARILNHVDHDKFRISIHELRLDGYSLPDPSLNCHRTDPHMDFPYRALVLERRD